MKTKKSKTVYQVSVFTPIKDGNHYTVHSRLYECEDQANTYAAQFDAESWITKVQEWHLPQH
jgi:hypothetical protein